MKNVYINTPERVQVCNCAYNESNNYELLHRDQKESASDRKVKAGKCHPPKCITLHRSQSMIVAPIALMYSELELEKTLAYEQGKEMSFLQKENKPNCSFAC